MRRAIGNTHQTPIQNQNVLRKIRCCRRVKKLELKNYEFMREIVERRITNPEKRLPVLSHIKNSLLCPCALLRLFLSLHTFRQWIMFALFCLSSCLWQNNKLTTSFFLFNSPKMHRKLAVRRIDRNSILKAFPQKSICHTKRRPEVDLETLRSHKSFLLNARPLSTMKKFSTRFDHKIWWINFVHLNLFRFLSFLGKQTFELIILKTL